MATATCRNPQCPLLDVACDMPSSLYEGEHVTCGTCGDETELEGEVDYLAGSYPGIPLPADGEDAIANVAAQQERGGP